MNQQVTSRLQGLMSTPFEHCPQSPAHLSNKMGPLGVPTQLELVDLNSIASTHKACYFPNASCVAWTKWTSSVIKHVHFNGQPYMLSKSQNATL